MWNRWQLLLCVGLIAGCGQPNSPTPSAPGPPTLTSTSAEESICVLTAKEQGALEESLNQFSAIHQNPFSKRMSVTLYGDQDEKVHDIEADNTQKRSAILSDVIEALKAKPPCLKAELVKYEQVLLAERNGKPLVEYATDKHPTDYHAKLVSQISQNR